MKKAVVIGAGKIGRGFIGQVFAESGYAVTFLDVNPAMVNALNEKGSYTLRCVSEKGAACHIIRPVQAICTQEFDRAVSALAACDIAATAVGLSAWPSLAKLLCEASNRRAAPLDVLLCENIPSARAFAYAQLNASAPGGNWQARIGFVPVAVGRMVPAAQTGELTDVTTEPELSLPVDGSAFLCGVPKLKYMEVSTDYGMFEARKLYIHNMGHAVCAYLGYQKGYGEIAESMQDRQLYDQVEACMSKAGTAIVGKYGVPQDEMTRYIQGLLHRFCNLALHDALTRVAADPVRKLSCNDRLLGAYRLITDYGMLCRELQDGIAAALLYNSPSDVSAPVLQAELKKIGVAAYLQGQGMSQKDAMRIEALHNRKKEKRMLISTNSGLFSAHKGQERFPMAQAMAFFAEAGFEAVDVNLSAVIYDDPFKHESILDGDWKANLDEVKKVIDDSGMKVSLSHLPFYAYTMEDKERLAYCDKMMARAIEAAAYIGAPYTVIHPYRNPTTHMTDTEGTVNVLRPWVEMGRKAGVTLCVENMKETAAEQLREIADTLDCGACWDVGHANLCGLDQYHSLTTLGKRLKVLHLHDNYGTKDDHSLPFLGTVDWQGIMNGLRDAGYEGVFNYEVQATALPEALRMEHARYLVKAAKIILSM